MNLYSIFTLSIYILYLFIYLKILSREQKNMGEYASGATLRFARRWNFVGFYMTSGFSIMFLAVNEGGWDHYHIQFFLGGVGHTCSLTFKLSSLFRCRS
jgi:hypothetical protein